MAAKPGQVMTGKASYYHDSLHGRSTASGAPYNKNAMTAAHKTLPLGTLVRVTDPNTGRSVKLKVNDRGPFVKGRIIDLSRRAARSLGMLDKGVTNVRVEVLSLPGGRET
jgi:rare lipoprotein A